MARLKELAREDMTIEQQHVYDAVVASPRGRFVGPYVAWIRNPKLTEAAMRYGGFCRYESSVPDRIRELAILLVARHWNADVEWWAHHPIALKAGLDAAVAEAIRRRERPAFHRRDEETVYDLVQELQETRRVSDPVYQRALAEFGETMLVELVATIGNYLAVAAMLNVFEIETPDGSRPMTA